MVNPRSRAAVELVLAGAVAALSALTWSQVRSTVAVAPVTDGQPVTFSVVFDPPLLMLALMLAAAAGVLAVLGSAQLFRARLGRPPKVSPGSAAAGSPAAGQPGGSSHRAVR